MNRAIKRAVKAGMQREMEAVGAAMTVAKNHPGYDPDQKLLITTGQRTVLIHQHHDGLYCSRCARPVRCCLAVMTLDEEDQAEANEQD